MCKRHASMRVAASRVSAQGLVLHVPMHTADASMCKRHASMRVTSVTHGRAMPRVLRIRARCLEHVVSHVTRHGWMRSVESYAHAQRYRLDHVVRSTVK